MGWFAEERPDIRYAEAVIDCSILACKYIVLVAKRHLDDLKKSESDDFPYYFDCDAAQHNIDFFKFFKHYKGEWVNEVVDLELWQQFYQGVLFGWRNKETGYRRFKTAYLEVARKAGKTVMASLTGLYMLDADGEPSAEIYSAATKRDQAKRAWKDAMVFINRSPSYIKKRFDLLKSSDTIAVSKTYSEYRPVGKDADTLDGLNAHACILDEVHAWKTREMWDVLEEATAGRRQPLMYAITTAGFDKNSICYELHDYLVKILEGIIKDDSFFGMIYCLDKEDDWRNEAIWIKANPNLGITPKIEYLRDKCNTAQEMPTKINSFLQKHCNIWTDTNESWLPYEYWEAIEGDIDEAALEGRTCYAGLDLSSTQDLTSFVLVFPPEEVDEPYKILPRFFVPAENMRERAKKDRVPYQLWAKSKHLFTTPGNVVDYDFVKKQILSDSERFNIAEIAFDPWNATQISIQLEDEGLVLVEFRQGYKSMSPAVKELQAKIMKKEIIHNGNPVLSWCFSNIVLETDAAENIKFNKAKSMDRIDGMVALAMSLNRAHVNYNDRSAYEEGEIFSF